MKSLITTLFMLITLSAWAQESKTDWKLVVSAEEAFISLARDSQIRSDVTINSGEQKILEVKILAPDIALIVYSSGVAGTKVEVEVIHGLIYNISTKEFLGDHPYQYKSKSSPYTLDQPVWKVEGKSLKITDVNTDTDVSIAL